VSELDDRLQPLRRQAREWATQLRPHALELDRDPTTVTRLLDLPAITQAARLQIPPAYNPRPLVLAGRRYFLASALERAVFCEETAWGDLGLMLALPGGSMSGVLVDVIGDHRQKEWFYGRLSERPTWTFFGLTEPAGGSDAGALLTTATRRGDGVLEVTGAKRYVSNAVRASFGAVFFRTGPGPLGIGSAVVDTSAAGFAVSPVETIGVRGAQLGAITLDAVEIPPERVLGTHLSPLRRGTAGWLRTFNLLRPTVAAMAVGLATAAHDYVREHRSALSKPEQDRLDEIFRSINGVRVLTWRAAAAVDRNSDDGHLASAAKHRAARLAEQVTRQALGFFGPGARLDHPLLDKMARDAIALEFMEGTGNVQRLSVFAAFARRR
jgi:alkylation response protein AidB-like acyl-CoA dehydrogenase